MTNRPSLANAIGPVILAAVLLVSTPGHARAADIDFWFGMTGPAAAAVQAECDGFNRSQARDRIQCVNVSNYNTLLQRTAAAYRAGKQPVLVQMMDAAAYEMIRSGAVVPAQSLLAQFGSPLPPALFSPALRRLYGDGEDRLYALPFNISTLLLYTNDDRLRRAGIAKAPDTWEDFTAAMRRLKAAGERCPFAYRLDPWWWLEQASAVQGEPVASGGEAVPVHYDFARTSHRQLLKDLLGWTHDRLAIQYGNAFAGSPQRAFAAQDCAMVLESSGTAGAFSRAAAGRFAVSAHLIPHYRGRVRRATMPGGAALWVLKGADSQAYRAAAAFLTFVRQPANQARFSRETGYLPLGPDALTQFAASHPPALQLAAVSVATASLNLDEKPQAAPRLGSYVRFRYAWTDEVERAFSGGQSIDQAIARTTARGDALLDRFARIYGNGAR